MRRAVWNFYTISTASMWLRRGRAALASWWAAHGFSRRNAGRRGKWSLQMYYAAIRKLARLWGSVSKPQWERPIGHLDIYRAARRAATGSRAPGRERATPAVDN